MTASGHRPAYGEEEAPGSTGPSRERLATPGAVRATRQGAVVSDLLERSDEFRTAQDMHAELRQNGERIGLTTVYRHLQRLADAGVVDVIHAGEGEAAYRRCATATHHHHLVCRSCTRTVEVQGPEVERWAERVASAAGYSEVDHTVEVFGLCPECAR